MNTLLTLFWNQNRATTMPPPPWPLPSNAAVWPIRVCLTSHGLLPSLRAAPSPRRGYAPLLFLRFSHAPLPHPLRVRRTPRFAAPLTTPLPWLLNVIFFVITLYARFAPATDLQSRWRGMKRKTTKRKKRKTRKNRVRFRIEQYYYYVISWQDAVFFPYPSRFCSALHQWLFPPTGNHRGRRFYRAKGGGEVLAQ